MVYDTHGPIRTPVASSLGMMYRFTPPGCQPCLLTPSGQYKGLCSIYPCFSSAAVMKYHSLRGLNGRNVFSHGSQGWKSKIRVPVWLDSGGAPLPGLQTAAFPLCPHTAGCGERERCLGSLLFLFVKIYSWMWTIFSLY